MNAQDYFQLGQDFLDAVQSHEPDLKAYATDTWAKFRFHRSLAYYVGYCDGLVEVLTSVSFNRFEIDADLGAEDTGTVLGARRDLMFGAGLIAECRRLCDLPERDSKHYDSYPSGSAVSVARSRLDRRRGRLGDGFRTGLRPPEADVDDYYEGFFSAVVTSCRLIKRSVDAPARVRRAIRADILIRLGAILVARPGLIEALP